MRFIKYNNIKRCDITTENREKLLKELNRLKTTTIYDIITRITKHPNYTKLYGGEQQLSDKNLKYIEFVMGNKYNWNYTQPTVNKLKEEKNLKTFEKLLCETIPQFKKVLNIEVKELYYTIVNNNTPKVAIVYKDSENKELQDYELASVLYNTMNLHEIEETSILKTIYDIYDLDTKTKCKLDYKVFKKTISLIKTQIQNIEYIEVTDDKKLLKNTNKLNSVINKLKKEYPDGVISKNSISQLTYYLGELINITIIKHVKFMLLQIIDNIYTK